MKKRLLAVSLSLLLAASALPGTSGAFYYEEGRTGDLEEVYNYPVTADVSGTKWVCVEKRIAGDSGEIMDHFVQIKVNGKAYVSGYPYSSYYDYDANGNLISSQDNLFNDLIRTHQYTPNEDGTLAQEVVTWAGGSIEIFTYFYNSEGYVTKIVRDYKFETGYSTEEGSSETTYTYKQTSEGMVVSCWDDNNDLAWRDTYNAAGKIEKQEIFGWNSRVVTFSYDSSGVLFRKEEKATDSQYKCIQQYSYDSNGYIIAIDYSGTMYDGSAGDSYTATFTYDSNGNLLTKRGDSLYEFTYQYDDHDNLVKIDVSSEYWGLVEPFETVTLKYEAIQTTPPITGTLGQNRDLTWIYAPTYNTLTLTGDALSASAPVVAAGYDSRGKMLFSTIVTETGMPKKFPQTADHYKLFWLDSGNRPKCESVTITP